MGKVVKIAFAGPSSSGKSTLKGMVMEEFSILELETNPYSIARKVKEECKLNDETFSLYNTKDVFDYHAEIITRKQAMEAEQLNYIVDRTFTDTYLYCKYAIDDIKDANPDMDITPINYKLLTEMKLHAELCDTSRYDCIFLLEPIPQDMRKSDEVRTDKYLTEKYQEQYYSDMLNLYSGMKNVKLIPHCNGDIDKRFDIICDHINNTFVRGSVKVETEYLFSYDYKDIKVSVIGPSDEFCEYDEIYWINPTDRPAVIMGVSEDEDTSSIWMKSKSPDVSNFIKKLKIFINKYKVENNCICDLANKVHKIINSNL